VIGVTGTKGKTTTANLIHQILTFSGKKAGLATTVNFKIGEKEWMNETKQTMLGRFQLQKLLREMVRSGCAYAIVETSSEGIMQFRHRFVDFDVAVFTNITPEHIERHGGFHLYRAAKVELFNRVARKPNGIGIYNLDEENVEYFLKPAIKTKIGYSAALKGNSKNQRPLYDIMFDHHLESIRLSPRKTSFTFDKKKFEMPLLGLFNAYNAAGAISTALTLGVEMNQIKKAIRDATPVPGRMELVDKGQDFTVIVDYAHEPASLEAVYRTVKNLRL
ncbi:MAG: Mur ligase family protein, partial [Patescibacteria group bacterium]